MSSPPGAEDEAAANQAALRTRVVLAVGDALEKGQTPAELRGGILAQFPEVKRATAYRWIAAALETGAAARTIAERERTQRDAQHRGAEAVLDDAMPQSSIAALPVMTEAINALRAMRRVLDYAEGTDPEKLRSPKLTLTASMGIMRGLKDIVDLHGALNDAARTDAFNQAMIAELKKESPDLAARVAHRLLALTSEIPA